jgi:hypothetical protein
MKAMKRGRMDDWDEWMEILEVNLDESFLQI